MARVEKNQKKDEAKKYRMQWTINPRTRVKESKKCYNRQRSKLQLKKGDY